MGVVLSVSGAYYSDKERLNLQSDIDYLKKERASLQNDINSLKSGQQETNTGILVIREQLGSISSGSPARDRSRLHISKFQVAPFVPGQRLRLDIFFENTGALSAATERYSVTGLVPITADLQSETATTEGAFLKSLDEAANSGAHSSTMIPPMHSGFFSDYGDILTEQQCLDLRAGKYLIIFAGKLTYQDKTGSHETTYCLFNKGNPEIKFVCSKNNDET